MNNQDDGSLIWFVLVLCVLALLMILLPDADAAELSPKIEREIRASAIHNGVDPSLALAIAEVESGFDAAAVGSLGEIGLFQLRPEFHPVVAGQTIHNIDVATKYLADLKRKCRGYGDAYFVCFNYGTARRLKYPRLFPYYKRVKAAQTRRQHLTTIAER